MTRFFAAALSICLLAGAAQAEFVIPSFVLGASSVDDGVAPLADVYALQLTNSDERNLDITAITLDLQAAELGVSTFFVDTQEFANPSDLTFMNVLPEFRGAPITDSFVVLPEGLDPLAVGSVFSADEIVANYTTAGGILVPAGQTVTVAHLSVPAGEVPVVPGGSGALGSVVFSDNSETTIVPEPATAILLGLAVAGFAARRV